MKTITMPEVQSPEVAFQRPTHAALVGALHDPNVQVRRKAVQTLCRVADPLAMQEITEALIDNDPGVRWLAAEGLAMLGAKGVEPLLQALILYADLVWMRQSAHHVLRTYLQQSWGRHLVPVMKALEGPQPALSVPPLAQRVFDSFKAVG